MEYDGRTETTSRGGRGLPCDAVRAHWVGGTAGLVWIVLLGFWSRAWRTWSKRV